MFIKDSFQGRFNGVGFFSLLKTYLKGDMIDILSNHVIS